MYPETQRAVRAPTPVVPPVRPFRIAVEPSVLDDLAARLARARWTGPAQRTSWDRGTSPAHLRALVDYWRRGYDWRVHEVRLNAIPQFLARVDDGDVHFQHVAAGRPPLLLLHGWPDSFDRFHRIVPRLAPSFDLVIPSIPGFAFSSPLAEPTMRRSAHVLWRLMTEVLGYDRFAIAGGDGGSAIAQLIAIDHPESVVGIHLTDLGWHALSADLSTLTRGERRYLQRGMQAFMKDGAYAMVQSTMPRALAAGLTDSPIALASWIADRFHAWTERPIDRDVLLTNIMLYWVTGAIGSSLAGYEAETTTPSLTPRDRVERPVGLALCPHDIGGIPPRRFAERTLAVARWTELPRGGHFAALEEPALYAHEIFEFFHERLP